MTRTQYSNARPSRVVAWVLGTVFATAAVPVAAQTPKPGSMARPVRTLRAFPARVAVFGQAGFPRYGVNSLASPAQIADDIRAAGVPTDVLEADALARPDTLNAKRYSVVILPYGNTYPQNALQNLRAFHQAGGGFVMTGIPFTHAAGRAGAQGWAASPFFGPSVRRVSDESVWAFRVQVEEERWTGVISSQFVVVPGQSVSVAAQIRETTSPGTRITAGEGQQDNLYIRFFDKTGKQISQPGAVVVPTQAWATYRAEALVPATAVFADVSLQMRRTGRVFLARGFAATLNGQAVALTNADLSKPGEVWVDLGHDSLPALWGPTGVGVGGFAGPKPDFAQTPGAMSIAPGDPLRLSGLLQNPKWQNPQWLDGQSLPKGVRLVPGVGTAKKPLLALLEHTGDAFKGAVDAWTYRTPRGDREDYETRQTLARAAVAVLARRGILTSAQEKSSLARLDKLPAPPHHANLVLPNVPRRYETFQPKMGKIASRLYVADVRTLNHDEKVLLLSLQGIVNRKQPRVYFLFDEDDRAWLDELRRKNETGEPVMVADPWSLVQKFRSEFRGLVLCDPKVYDSACVGVSLAGADDLLVALTPEMAARANVPVTRDLRGKFKDDADALRYLRTDVLPRLDPYLTCSLDPAVYDAGSIDQVIAARGSFFWITGPRAQTLPGANQSGEMAEVRALIASLPLGAVVRGFWWHGDGMGLSESDGVALGSRFGKITLVSDLITNLSVHSGVSVAKLTQKPQPPAPALDSQKVYVAFTMSDGDNLCTWRGYFKKYFSDPLRGTFPVGWGMGPTLIDLAPDMARWYYEQATPNDEFICDVSGVAYMYPPSFGTVLRNRDEAFRLFYNSPYAL